MVKISLEISAFHPAIVSAVGDLVDVEKLLEVTNAIVNEGVELTGDGDTKGNIRTKAGKDTISVSASGSIKGIKLPKNDPAAQLARIHWYLSGSAELYLQVQSIALPLSVREWVHSKQFRLAGPAVPA